MKTAVEWLRQELLKRDMDISIKDLFEQAMEMEKEQMRSASCPFIGGWEDEEFEDWYNETFKK